MLSPTDPRWNRARRVLDPNRGADREQYVEPPESAGKRVVFQIRASPEEKRKYLLAGARGGGKSSELRRIARDVGDVVTVLDIDLGGSGVSPESVSAFDLLYLGGLAALRELRRQGGERLDDLWAGLRDAYAGEPTRARDLGEMSDALDSLAGFAGLAGAAMVAAGGDAGPVGVVGATLGLVGKGLRLLSDRKVVDATSPRGLRLQAACVRVAWALEQQAHRTALVLVDGLERLNGTSQERFRSIFESTDLLATAPWAAVYAAPPCTITDSNAADGRGYVVVPVWGFDPDAPELRRILRQRLASAGWTEDEFSDALIEGVAEGSGGVPRHAMEIARLSVDHAQMMDLDHITEAAVQAGRREKAMNLWLGAITSEAKSLLRGVREHGDLPDANPLASSLFADGRVLVRPPGPGETMATFVVHPLLLPELLK